MRTGASVLVVATLAGVVVPLMAFKRLRAFEETSVLGVVVHGSATDADDEDEEHQKVYQPHAAALVTLG